MRLCVVKRLICAWLALFVTVSVVDAQYYYDSSFTTPMMGYGGPQSQDRFSTGLS